MNPYRRYVSDIAALYRAGRDLPAGGFSPCSVPDRPGGARTAVILSPHPDDEAIVGGLALRLLREDGMRVVNVAVTSGSDPARRRPRLEELKGCCGYLGFELRVLGGEGLERIDLRGREESPGPWVLAVEEVVETLVRERPDVVFCPHDTDQHRTHTGTHYLFADALERLPRSVAFYVAETEFWSPMAAPNLAVELSEADAGDLIAALSFHEGEIRRNPYHLRLPAWLMDNVRRGAELVGDRGGVAPDFVFATLYRLRRWEQGRFRTPLERGRFLAASENAGVLFPVL